ncbi:MAG: asparagine synthase (glutamine-hydrolyzing) [Betaproteobacteria bacterium]|nr:asparagine synthase (glutamine-hydrolyzing) [Betaproteobacteria bacterium]
MCGIAGFLSPSPLRADDAQTARAMGDRLQHRGPDGRGEWLDAEAGIALVHRRLAIVDVSPAGHQPMCSADGRWVITFNGEIYNHLELRGQLEAQQRAPHWRGHSDTETLLAALVAWGLDEAIRRAVGMFALALWDREERTLTLVRDRLGEKPLYYGVQGGVLMFGSELKALQAHPHYRAAVDRGALSLLLRLGYVPAPWSIHTGIRKLPPGSLLRLKQPADADLPPTAYWSVLDAAVAGAQQPLALDDTEAVEALDQLLRQSIDGQRVADVPLGAFLSGGIDSSATVAVMQALSTTPVRTFTIGLPDEQLDESAFARAVARHLGTSHTELTVTADETLSLIPRMGTMYCEPFADPSQIPTFLVSQLARRNVKVALSGDAGDELFGGYDRYRWAQGVARVPLGLRRVCGAALRALPAEAWSALLAPVAGWLPAELREGHRADRLRKLAAVLSARSDDEVYRQMVTFWPDGASPVPGAVQPHTVLSEAPPALRTFETRMMLLDARSYLPDDILVKVDRAAMAASLETRVPLLDHRIVEFAFRLPLHQKVRHGQGKWVLRQVLDRYVPRALVERPKKGFGIPIHAWLRGPLRGWAEDLLSEDRLRRAGLIDPVPVRRLWHEHLSERNDWGYRLWPVLMFEAWRDASAGLVEPSA